MKDLKNFREQLDSIEQEILREEQILFGYNTGTAQNNNLVNSKKYQEILAILNSEPILVDATLRWLQKIKAQIAQATLSVLYTSEELEELKGQMLKEK